MASWSELSKGSLSLFFSAEYDSGWIKEHGRLQRWRLQRVSIDPEQAGLCGCWQFIAIWRQRQKLRGGRVLERSEEYSFYASSFARDERTAGQLAQSIRDHWSACEIGSHYRRDVTLGEDASQIGGRGAAHVMATLRNLVLGLFELQKENGQTASDCVPGWQRKMSASDAIRLIKKGG